MGVVIFNGISSQDYGIQVEHPPGYQIPARDYEIIHIPGRNGDLVIDNGSYQNVNRSYELSVGSRRKKFTDMANMVAEWLHSASGYARLEDSYEPEYYRMAMLQEEVDIENILRHAGRATVNFNCKPQRFLKSGEENIQLYGKSVLRNPTRFASLPEITVYGSGTGSFRVGAFAVDISNIKNSITLDSDIQDAYTGDTNRNADIVLYNGFPKLVPGENEFSWSSAITRMEVVPRWWTL